MRKLIKSIIIFYIAFSLVFIYSLSFAQVTKEELLKLLVKTFLGTGDLKSAYEVSLYGKKIYPKDPFWYETLAQISLWISKPEEALEAFLELYKFKKNKEIRKKIIDLAVSLNRFDIAVSFIEEEIKEGGSYELEDIYYIYLQAGDIEKLINLLKAFYFQKQDKEILYRLVTLLYDLGKLDEAYTYGKFMISKPPIVPNEVILFANILFAKREPEKAYQVLKEHLNILKDYPKDETFINYHRFISDLGWSMKDFEKAAESSLMLYNLGKAEESDYVKLYTYYFYKKEYSKSFLFAFEGFKKYKLNFLLEGSVESLYRLKDFQKIVEILRDKESELIDNTLLFSRYIVSLIVLKNWEKAKELLENIPKEKISLDLIQELIYVSLENSDQKLAFYIKTNFFYLENHIPKAFGLLYFFLQDGRKALNLLSPLKESSSVSDQILYSDLLDLYGRFEEAQKIRFDLFKKLSKKNAFSDEELAVYLRVSAYFLNFNEYSKLLDKYKDLISLQVYNDLYYSYLLQQEQHPTLEFLLKRYKTDLRPWMLLNLALWEDDREFQNYLLKNYSEILPIRDRVTAFERTGRISQAMEYAFKGLEANREDYLLYKQMRDMVVSYRPKFDFQTAIIGRGEAQSFSSGIDFSLPISFSTSFFIKANYLKMFKEDKDLIIKTPVVQELLAGIYKLSNFGKFSFSLGFLDSQEENVEANFEFEKYIKPRTNLKIRFGKNIPTDETILLQYGGMKDIVELNLTHNITNRLFFYTSPSYNRYHSSEGKYLGEGFYIYNELSYKLRVTYPDYTFRLYTMHGIYNEKSGYKGKIEELSAFPRPQVLSDSFNEIGVGFLFGWENYETYVRVWRPFLSLHTGFNDVTDVNYSVFAGIGGALLGQDNLSINFSYIKSYKGSTEEIKTLQIRYILYF